MTIFSKPTSGGKQMPLQRIKNVYTLVDGVIRRIDTEHNLFVSHFETCPKADEFSRSKKK